MAALLPTLDRGGYPVANDSVLGLLTIAIPFAMGVAKVRASDGGTGLAPSEPAIVRGQAAR